MLVTINFITIVLIIVKKKKNDFETFKGKVFR